MFKAAMFKDPAKADASTSQGDGSGDCEDPSDHNSLGDDNEDPVGLENSHKSNSKTEAIAKRETRIVCGMRLIVLLVLVASTAFLAIFVHSYLRDAEQEEFRREFTSEAKKVLESIGATIEHTLGSVDALAVAMVTYAQAANETWPCVTLPNFAVRATKTRRLAKSVLMTVHPLVEDPDRAKWQNYTRTHNGWVQESLAVQSRDEHFHGPIVERYFLSDSIYDYTFRPQRQRDVYAPMWQTSPVIPVHAPYNFDVLGLPTAREQYNVFMQSHKVMLTPARLLPNRTNEAEMRTHQGSLDFIKDYAQPGQNPDEPISDILYPILDATKDVMVPDPQATPMPAFFSLTFYWRHMIENILASSSRGMLVVFSSPCNPSFTFQINGPDVVYLGRGDYHDANYDHMEVASTLQEVIRLSSNEISFYSGVPVDDDFCPFTFQVFPSKEREDDFTSSDPVIFSILVAGVFLFTSLVFICYDSMVELRQRRVMNEATNSSEIVASLFPKAVRERIYQEVDDRRQRHSKMRQLGTRKSSFKQSKMQDDDGIAEVTESGNYSDHMTMHRQRDIKSRPIADLFKDTTIFFGDLVGFTKWSSTRSPEEVFVLLETIYGAFDTIAERRGVFKVETIGDCYVAATGLPTPQKDHAVNMVRFARDCLYMMSQVTNNLATELGEDTNQLRMRVGLHSGPTTAGVLRGIKGRFQLFGNTVNMASRMESTGIPGHIQVSQSTANELALRRKEHWLRQRADLVNVKGKGTVQTYFVVADAAQSATTTTHHSSHTGAGDVSDRNMVHLYSGTNGLLGGIDDVDGDVDDDLDILETLRELTIRKDDQEGGHKQEDLDQRNLEQQLKGYLSRSDGKRISI